MTIEYTAKNINALSGLAHVRLRPSLYIGSTDDKGITHLLFEIFDNSVDEHLASYGQTIYVRITEEGIISVEDQGRGCPSDIHPEKNISALTIIFTETNAGGKFNDDGGYAGTGTSGLHGLGSAVTNFLSEYLFVRVNRDGFQYTQRYERGVPVTEVTKVPFDYKTTGTYVEFKPDSEIFKDSKLDFQSIEDKLKRVAYLNKGLKVVYTTNEIQKEFQYKNGLEDFVKDYLFKIGKESLLDSFFSFEDTVENTKINVTMSWALDSYDENIFSFANTVNTPEHGTHLEGARLAINKTITDYGLQNGIYKSLSKSKKEDFDVPRSPDIFEGIVLVVDVRAPDLSYESQIKQKLTTPRIRTIVNTVVKQKLEEWLYANKGQAKLILDKAYKSMKVRLGLEKSRDLLRDLNDVPSLAGSFFIDKLTNCKSKDITINELYCCEGDSASGSIKASRDSYTQAIYPLRGKPLNSYDLESVKVLANEEFKNLISLIGTGIGKNYDYSKLRYGKIIIATDADSDGKHISSLLSGFFYKFFQDLIIKGHFYHLISPLYKVRTKQDKYIWINTDRDLDEYKKHSEHLIRETQRIKGLGELSPKDAVILMDPNLRTLKKLTLSDFEKASASFEKLLGDDPSERRKFIEEKARLVSWEDLR